MKTTANYFLIFLLFLFLFSCTGKSTKSQNSQSNKPKVLKDSFFSKDLTGEKTGKPINDIFFKTVEYNVIRGRLEDFEILSNHYFDFDRPFLDSEPEGNVKYVRTKYFTIQRSIVNPPYTDIQISYDDKGVITSYILNKREKNFRVTYLADSPVKFESITSDEPGHGIIHKCDFNYNTNGILQSIFIYEKFGNNAVPMKNEINFIYYEHGIAVDSTFYSFMKDDPSKIYQVRTPSKLWFTNSIDKNGNQYYISEQETGNYNLHDTVAIYDKNNRWVFHYQHKYSIRNNDKNKYMYTKFDSKGNWIKEEKKLGDFLYICEREINYY